MINRFRSHIEIDTTDIRRRGPEIPEGVARSGAYRITFADGQEFAGITENITLRLGSHARTWSDMEPIEFWPGIGAWEPSTVRPRISVPGPALRKIDIEDPGIDPILDRMRWQDEFLLGQRAMRPPELPDQRARTLSKFEQLAGHPDFATLVSLIRVYLSTVVPAPPATEVDNWVITSLPSTMRTRHWHRLICLSINNVEAVTIGEQFDGERWSTLGFVSANPSHILPGELLTGELRDSGVFLAPAWYETVGPVYQIGFDSLAGFSQILEDEDLLELIGALAMRLIKRGRGLYRRFHDYNLADVLLDGSMW